MDDDDYQRMVDYENEIYCLYSNRDDGLEDEGSSETCFEASDSDVVPENGNRSSDGIVMPKDPVAALMSSSAIPSVFRPQFDNSDSSGMSEDERDLIYSRLYHSGPRPTTTKDPTQGEAKKKSSPHKNNSMFPTKIVQH